MIKILIIDDDASSVESLIEYLERVLGNEFEIDLASTTEVAARKLKKMVFDLILSDIYLSNDISGVEFLKRIREGKVNGQINNIPCIFITGDGSRKYEKILGSELFNPVQILYKPVNLDNLLKTIKEMIVSV